MNDNSIPDDSLAILKRRLLLKQIELKINCEVHWNFGYSPNNVKFDRLVEKRNNLSGIVRKTDSDWWNMYDRYREKGNCKKLMVFL